jgi:hypothetical protein
MISGLEATTQGWAGRFEDEDRIHAYSVDTVCDLVQITFNRGTKTAGKSILRAVLGGMEILFRAARVRGPAEPARTWKLLFNS